MNITLDIDGPRDPGYVLEAAEAASQAIRVLCHLTRDHGSLRSPAQADRLLRYLEAAAAGYRQLLGQVSAWLEEEQSAGRIEMHGGRFGGRPDLAQAAVTLCLDAAEHAADQVRYEIHTAAGITTDMATACGAGNEEDGDG